MSSYRVHFKPRRARTALSKREVILIKTIILITLISIIMFFCGLHVKPILRKFLLSETENLTFYRVNKAVERNISADNVNYDDLVFLEKDEQGRISAIKTNMQKMNLLMTKTSEDIYNDLLYDDIITLRLPLGNLIGIDLLSGFGPKIPFRIVPINSVSAEYKNTFISAGVNQTRHQIMLTFSVPLALMLPGSEEITVSVEICVAETVIVGAAPQFFAGLRN